MPFPNDGSALPIANSALTLVGTRLLSSVNDTSKECTLVKTNWDQYRKAVLRDGLWKFAKEIKTLTKDVGFTTTEFGYTTRYAVPTDYLRIVSFNDFKGNADGGEAPYKLMGGFIYTNMSYANLTYIADISDVRQWDALFCEAFSAYLYERLCKSLTGGDPDVRAYRDAIRKAKFAGSTEDPSEQLDIDVWMQARVGIPSIGRDPDFPAQTTPTFP